MNRNCKCCKLYARVLRCLFFRHIQFTMENEHDFSLPFLDVLVSRNVCKENHTTNTSLTTAIYKKSTHTDRYLHYTSHRPKHQKLTVTKTQLNRVETYISLTDKNQKSGELRNIRSTLQLNGFPTRATFLSRKNKRSQTHNSQFKQFTSIPNVHGTSERIRRVLNEAGVGVAMRPVKPFAIFCPPIKIRTLQKIRVVLFTRSLALTVTMFILVKPNVALSHDWPIIGEPQAS